MSGQRKAPRLKRETNRECVPMPLDEYTETTITSISVKMPRQEKGTNAVSHLKRTTMIQAAAEKYAN
jgi:hypothetical protein